jgi:subtilase family serine protease
VRRRRSLVLAAAVSLVAGIASPLVAGSKAGAAPSGTVVLKGSRSQAATRTRSVGAVSDTSAVDFQLALNPRDRAGAEAFARAVSDSTSASYRHPLSAAEWEARFSPTDAQVGKAGAWLRSQGFTVTSVSTDRLAIHASGTAAQVKRAFKTNLSLHSLHGQNVRLADSDLSIPADLAGIVAGAVGVNETFATHAARTPIPQPPGFRVGHPCGAYYNQKFDTVRPPYGHGYPYPAPYAVCGYAPPQIRAAYQLPSRNTGGADGSGVTVAVLDAYASPTLLADAQQYARINDPTHPFLASKFSEVLAPKFDRRKECDASGWSGEQTLDIEAVHATAPGAKILYVGAQNCFNALFDSLRTIVDGGLANVITNSWGDTGGDLFDDAATRRSVDDTLLMAAGTGITVLVSSGDNGDEFSTLGISVPDYPASSPWITAVGGTTLQVGSAGQRLGELGWSSARSFLCNAPLLGTPGCSKSTLNTWLPVNYDAGGSGGGTSYSYTQPYYQKGVVPNDMATRNAPLFGPVPTRVVPDISMVGDPATGFLVGETQSFPDGTYYDQYRIGGTSVSSPLFAGVVAIADQISGQPLGFVNPLVYKLHTAHPATFFDVVPGGKQDQSRVDFANSVDNKDGLLFSTRIIDYQGVETYCDGAGNCASRKITISTRKGYDDMTGLGAPTAGFVGALAKM